MTDIKINPLSSKFLLSDGRYCALLGRKNSVTDDVKDIYIVQFSDLHTEAIHKHSLLRRATRFEQEYSGLLGEYWKSNADKTIQKYINDAYLNAEVDKDGAISWKSNGQYLMDDFCEVLEFGGYPFSREMTRKKRDEQVQYQLGIYKLHSLKESCPEELSEMRSVFGEGTTVVNVITGKKVRL